MKRALIALLLLTGCATTTTTSTSTATTTTPAADCHAENGILNATLWMQTAAEYDASALQTYAAARRMLDAALADRTWTAATEQTTVDPSLPPAIILDLDETALDNAAYEARLIRAGEIHNETAWSKWVGASIATAIPGAGEFLQYAKSRGVTPFYITNRTGDQEAATRRNLERLGFPLDANLDTLLTKAEREEWKPSDKSPRRAHVARTHRVLLLLGDDLNDFAFASGKTIEERDAIIRNTRDHWGTRWFILPNAMYGSWEQAIIGRTPTTGPCDNLQRRLNAVRPE